MAVVNGGKKSETKKSKVHCHVSPLFESRNDSGILTT